MAPVSGRSPLLAAPFDARGLAALRRAVARVASAAGIAGERADDVVMAVNEITTNAVAHAGGAGVLRIWALPDRLICEVTDQGGGLPPEGVPDPPPATATSGRGLWLAGQVSTVSVRRGSSGTTVRLAFVLPPGPR